MFRHDPRCVRCGHKLPKGEKGRFCGFTCEQAHDEESSLLRETYKLREITMRDIL